MTHPELIFRAYTRCAFPTPEAAIPLITAFANAGELLVPSHYGSHEPIGTPFDPAEPVAPAKILSNRPRELFLTRTRPRYFAHFTWTTGRRRPWIWSIVFDKDWVENSEDPTRIREFLVNLCVQYPPVFAACATGDDWDQKHRIYDERTGSDLGTRGILLNPGEGLPGIYWFTFLGPELVSFFQAQRLMGLGAYQMFDRGKAGLGMQVYQSPSAEDQATRRHKEHEVVRALGEKYFFSAEEASRKRPRQRVAIPGATDHR
jgi:hypothetical protein